MEIQWNIYVCAAMSCKIKYMHILLLLKMGSLYNAWGNTCEEVAIAIVKSEQL